MNKQIQYLNQTMANHYPIFRYFFFLILVGLITGCFFSPNSIELSYRYQPSPAGARWVEDTLALMSLEEKVGQLIITGVEGEAYNNKVCLQIERVKPGGILFQAHNVYSPAQLSEFIKAVDKCSRQEGNLPLLMAITYEGESVQAFRTGATSFPSALAMGATGDHQIGYQVAYAAGNELAYSGINMVLGPVADTLTNPANEVVSLRTYGGDANQVSEFVRAGLTGYRDAGLIPVIKHFPGHGGVSEDSHVTLPIDRSDRNRLYSAYLPPFQAGIDLDVPVVMMSHVAFPVITGNELPASLSSEMVRILREELGFPGVVLSDSMRMKGVTGENSLPDEASLRAFKAGMDMLLLNDPRRARQTADLIKDEVIDKDIDIEQLDAAVRRILTLKAAWGLIGEPNRVLTMPNLDEHNTLALSTGAKAVTEYRDDQDLLPISPDLRKLFIIGPDQSWGFYDDFQEKLIASGFEPHFEFYPAPWKGSVGDSQLIDELVNKSKKFDLVIVFTWQAYLTQLLTQNNWQGELIQALLRSDVQVIAVALKSPTDLLAYPEIQTYLATFGASEGALSQVIDIILGNSAAQGINPLPYLH
jgi:beta-N-acetylhexosaminidase